MTEEFWTGSAEFTQSYGSGHGLSTEERRMLTLRNLAMSKAAKRKKKKQRTVIGERRMTEAERRERELARIREERQTRGALSEENRRMAAFSAAAANPEPEPPAPPRQSLPEPPMPKRSEPPELQEPDIDIALPEEPKPKNPAEQDPKSKRNQKTKRKSRGRTAAAGRFGVSANAAGRNRITTGGSVTLGILTGVLIGTVIYGRVQTNEIYTKIAELQVKYDDLTARNVSMKSEMEAKMTVKNIEEYAEKELGLLPLNQSQIEYIQIQTEDEVVISEPEDNIFVTVNDYLVSIWEFLRGK